MKTNQEIHITTDGKTTYAVLEQNGKVLSRSEAKCHPDDKFDFETGAKIAFDRLEIKYDIKIYHHEESFEVGDIVEYISDEVSQLDIKYFPPKGTRGEILELDDHKFAAVDYCVRVRWEKGTTGGNGEWWCSAKKLKKVESKYSFKVGDRVRFRSWDDMKREFGVDCTYGISGIGINGGKIYFTPGMFPLCGTYATIGSMHKCKNGLTEVKLKDFSCKDTSLSNYVFSTEMLEPASTKKR